MSETNYVSYDTLEDEYDPKSIAWKLLTDGNIGEFSCDILSRNYDDDDISTFKFEILLTIYIELIVNFYKMCHIMETGEEENFKLNFEEMNLETFSNFTPIMSKIHILPIVDISEEIPDGYYCKIYFRDIKKDKTFFIKNRKSNDVLYHFVISNKFKNTENLEDIFAFFEYNGTYYKISFEILKMFE